MDIETTVTLIPTKEEPKKDKEYYLKCYRLKHAIKTINRTSADFATGKLYPDEGGFAAIAGVLGYKTKENKWRGDCNHFTKKQWCTIGYKSCQPNRCLGYVDKSGEHN